MAAADNAKLARDVYDLFNRMEFGPILEGATDDVQVDLVSFGMTFEGREGLLQFMKGFKDPFPDLEVTVTHQVASDDAVVNECTWHATHTGPLQSPGGEIPPTGSTVSGVRFCEVWTFRDGKLARLVNYQDPSIWLRQLGLA